MSTITNRLSFIGKRPINFFKCDVKIDIFPLSFDTKYVKFGKLPFYSAIKVSGRFGSYDINLVDGLICQIAEGLSPSESKLNISIDKAKYESFNKYQRAFLKSMHGTTNSVLMRYIEGVAEVIYIIAIIKFYYFIMNFRATKLRYNWLVLDIKHL
jgi:hypothetical protein